MTGTPKNAQAWLNASAASQMSCNVPPTHAGLWGDAARAASPSIPRSIQLASAPGSVPPRSSAGVCPRSYPPIEDMGEAVSSLPRDAISDTPLERRGFA